jgi:hypothetical protein
MPNSISKDRIEEVLNRLEVFLEKDEWRGWDPYDGLNSKFLNALTLNLKWLRIAAIQIMKRSPVNLRTILGVPKQRNPKAMGLLVSAYILKYRCTKDVRFLDKARNILDWLIGMSTGYNGFSWGYNFNWQSTAFYVPRGIPTVVNSVFIAHAFLDLYKLIKEKDYLDIARSTCDFILNDLNKCYPSDIAAENEVSVLHAYSGDKTQNGSFCYSYTPLDKTCVFNASILAAELLARVYIYTQEKVLHEQSRHALKFVLASQNDDGSWFYGLTPSQKYIDSFHTGFLLVSLKNILANLNYLHRQEYRLALTNGYDYYTSTFFDDNGKPHYYHNSIYPIDLHCSAQGIITHVLFKDFDSNAIDTAYKIASWAIDNMWDNQKGYFYFQKAKRFINKTPYVRWPNAWMYLALMQLLRAEG